MITSPFQCKTHKCTLDMIPCPDNKPGCLVAHFRCLQCKEEHKQPDEYQQEREDRIEIEEAALDERQDKYRTHE